MRFVLLVAALCIFCCSCSLVKATQLEQAVVSALADDPRTKDCKFEVSLQDDGKVLITGEVYNAEQVAAVREIALGVEGVEDVINRAHVEEPGSGMLQDEVVVTPFL